MDLLFLAPGLKTFFVLNSAEHDIFSANKYENASNMAFSYLLADKFSCSAMFGKNEFAIVSNLGFISRIHVDNDVDDGGGDDDIGLS